MVTTDVKGKVDRTGEAFWTGGRSNPLEIIGQLHNSLQSRAFRGEL